MKKGAGKFVPFPSNPFDLGGAQGPMTLRRGKQPLPRNGFRPRESLSLALMGKGKGGGARVLLVFRVGAFSPCSFYCLSCFNRALLAFESQ